jgi:small subunit ribosomal protein S35
LSTIPRRTFTQAFTRAGPRRKSRDEDENIGAEEEERLAVQRRREISKHFFAEAALKRMAPEDQAKMNKLLSKYEMESLPELFKQADEEAAAWNADPRPTTEADLAALPQKRMGGPRDGLWYDDDFPDEPMENLEGDNFNEDDITSMAHGKLDEIREHRHYARITAWEMPLLASQFSLPSSSHNAVSSLERDAII